MKNNQVIREAVDPDGNVIREGMSIVCHRKTWVVSHIDTYNKSKMVVADRTDDNGRKSRLIVGHRKLRLIQVIGFQLPKTTYK